MATNSSEIRATRKQVAMAHLTYALISGPSSFPRSYRSWLQSWLKAEIFPMLKAVFPAYDESMRVEWKYKKGGKGGYYVITVSQHRKR